MKKVISNHAAAAKQIREFLKSKKIKGTVRASSYSGGSSVRVGLHGETPEVFQMVNEFAKRYQYGSFDGMTDCYEYTNRNDGLPQVKFVFVENPLSDEQKAAVYSWAASVGLIENAPATYDSACNAFLRVDGQPVQAYVARLFGDRDSIYWRSQTANA